MRSPEAGVRRVVLIEGAINAALLCLKLLVGFATNSLAILADAVHSLSDLANNAIAWVVIRIAHQPPDANHPYGHRKFEILAVFGLATLLAVAAFELALNALRRGQSGTVIDSTPAALALMGLVLAVNLATALWQRRKARELRSTLLYADAQHTLADVFTTLGVIAGWQLAAIGFPAIDALATWVVAGTIFYLSFNLFRRTLPVLVDEVALDPAAIRDTVQGVAGVATVRRVRSRTVGDSAMIDLVVTVDPQLSTLRAHGIADQVERALADRFDVADIVVHVEPEP